MCIINKKTVVEAIETIEKTNNSEIPKRNIEILKMRFGLIDGKPKSLETVGKKFGLQDIQIRQIEAITLKKIIEK